MVRWLSAAILLVPSLASATTIIALPEAELTRAADAIVFGRIITTRTLASTTQDIVATEAVFQVYGALKGSKPGEVIRIQVPGGQARGRFYQVPGAPHFEPGQMWVGFLARHEPGVYTPFGLGYGMLPARRDAEGTVLVRTDTDELALVSPTEGAEPMRFDDTPLTVFFARIALWLGAAAPPAGSWGTGVQQ